MKLLEKESQIKQKEAQIQSREAAAEALKDKATTQIRDAKALTRAARTSQDNVRFKVHRNSNTGSNQGSIEDLQSPQIIPDTFKPQLRQTQNDRYSLQ